MSILANKHSKVIVQGMTGREGQFHTEQMIKYGTPVVGGVTPGKGGQWSMGVPIFNTVLNARQATGANASVIFVPPRFAADAILEAADAGIELVVCITEGIPVLDMIRVKNYLKNKPTRLVGPNCPGLITPGEAKLGIISGAIVTPGPIGVVSKSGTLTYEVVYALTSRGIGQTTCVGIGGDPIQGTNFIDVLQLFEEDPDTEQVIMIGEIGGDAEEKAAAYISQYMTKPVIGFIAGRTAPPGRRMGHAGAIIEGSSGTAEAKEEAMRAAGVRMAEHPDQIVELLL
ncbi:MAG: succinate--CoA ligase subunit alpha [Anaerolineae bacterium]|nr:succinate--CoA ligase subunit alpha [Anaerolineae bacterium]